MRKKIERVTLYPGEPSRTLDELAKSLGVKRNTLLRRMQRGIPLDKPPRGKAGGGPSPEARERKRIRQRVWNRKKRGSAVVGRPEDKNKIVRTKAGGTSFKL